MKIRLLLCFLALLIFPRISTAQCSSAGSTNAGAITPTTSWQTVTRAAGNKFYYTFTATACQTYTFSFCQGGGSATYDPELTITDNTAGTTFYGYNDQGCGNPSELIWTCNTSGTYRIHVSKWICSNPTASSTLAYIYATSNTTNANYALNGNATSNSPYNCTTLTAASNNQLGCAWDVNSTLNFGSNFTYDFTINLGSSNAGADGMSFTIQNDARGLCACGAAGGSMGAGTISNSLIIEIDTYINFEDRDDFTGADFIGCSGSLDLDHLDMWTGGNVNPDLDGNCSVTSAGERTAIAWAVALTNGGSYYDIENGLNHILRISWVTGSPGTLTARIMDNTATTTYGTASYSFNPMTVFGTNTPYFGFTASTGGLNNTQSFCNPSSLLPIELLSFDVKKHLQTAHLNWATATESNNRNFTIEKSADGKEWRPIANLASKAPNGNSIVPIDYSYADAGLYPGNNYYRLKQVDIDGKFSYSEIKYIYNGHVTPVVFPNPFEDYFNLNVLAEEGTIIKYTVYDNLGRIVSEHTETQNDNGTANKIIDITGAPGIYFLLLQINEERFSYKLVKK